MLDFHSHLIPGVDDGSTSLEESRTAIASLTMQGVTTIITTPHLRASLLSRVDETAAYFELVDSAWDELKAMAAVEFPALRLERGFELMLDMPHVDLSNPLLRLAGTRFVLVEFPFSALPPNSSQVLFDIKMAGYQPIVAHPERYIDMDRELTVANEWRRVGAALQVNSGSLIGAYNPKAQSLGWKILRSGMADYLSSDYHARGMAHIVNARTAMENAAAVEQYNLLTTVNPERILQDEAPLPVPAVREPEKKGWRKWFGGQ